MYPTELGRVRTVEIQSLVLRLQVPVNPRREYPRT